MCDANREQVEMATQGLCVELELLCLVNGKFDDAKIATLELCQKQLNQLIQHKI